MVSIIPVTEDGEEALTPAVQEWIRLISLGIVELIRMTAIEAAKSKGIDLTPNALKAAGFRPEFPIVAVYSGLLGFTSESLQVEPPEAKRLLDHIMTEIMEGGSLENVGAARTKEDMDALIK